MRAADDPSKLFRRRRGTVDSFFFLSIFSSLVQTLLASRVCHWPGSREHWLPDPLVGGREIAHS